MKKIIFCLLFLSLAIRLLGGKAFADTITVQVAASADDAREQGGGGGVNTTIAYGAMRSNTGGTASTNYFCWGGRFQTVNVPQGATINTAYIEWYEHWGGAGSDANFTLYGNDVDDAADFTDNANIFTTAQRPRTDASVSFVDLVVAQGWYGSSYEIKSIIQEIVNRPGWSANNDMVLLAIANIDQDVLTLYPRNQDNGTGDAARLHIEYTGVLNLEGVNVEGINVN